MAARLQSNTAHNDNN